MLISTDLSSHERKFISKSNRLERIERISNDAKPGSTAGFSYVVQCGFSAHILFAPAVLRKSLLRWERRGLGQELARRIRVKDWVSGS
jgi:hypothetical protein